MRRPSVGPLRPREGVVLDGVQARIRGMTMLDSRDADVQALIGAIDCARATLAEPAALVRAVAQHLSSFTGGGAQLPARYREPDADRYAQHVLYVSPDRGFSLVSLVWRPGQGTPIHDHRSWCAVSVSEGCERETRFRLLTGARGRAPGTGAPLEAVSTRDTRPGEAVALVADGTDLHRVVNCTDGVTISLHAYGLDIERHGTSVNRSFEAPLPL